MPRKWIVLAAFAAAITTLAAGLAMADEDDSPLHKLMEKVQTKYVAITKGVRNETTYKKAQKDVATAATDLVTLAKEAKPLSEGPLKAAKENKEATQANWDKYMDALVKSSDDLAKVAAKADSKQAVVKNSFTAVKKACSDCHTVFRVEE